MSYALGSEPSKPGAYQFTVDQCDVEPEARNALQSFRDKRRNWLVCMETDEHAIWRTISDMVWSDMSFRTIAMIAEKNSDSPIHNQLLTQSLIAGYFATQVLGVRRVIDTTKGTISLFHLLNDIKRSLGLFTRENFICFDGLPYDWQVTEVRVRQAMTSRLGDKLGLWMPSSGPDAWHQSMLAHEQFDRLTGIKPENRKRDDRLPKKVVTRLESWLAQGDIERMVLWSHVNLAHASMPGSQDRVDLGDEGPTLDKISDAIRAFARVSEAISAILLRHSGRGMLVAIAQFDQFERLDFPDGGRPALDEFWEQLSKERNGYLDGVEAALLGPQEQQVTDMPRPAYVEALARAVGNPQEVDRLTEAEAMQVLKEIKEGR